MEVLSAGPPLPSVPPDPVDAWPSPDPDLSRGETTTTRLSFSSSARVPEEKLRGFFPRVLLLEDDWSLDLDESGKVFGRAPPLFVPEPPPREEDGDVRQESESDGEELPFMDLGITAVPSLLLVGRRGVEESFLERGVESFLCSPLPEERPEDRPEATEERGVSTEERGVCEESEERGEVRLRAADFLGETVGAVPALCPPLPASAFVEVPALPACPP